MRHELAALDFGALQNCAAVRLEEKSLNPKP